MEETTRNKEGDDSTASGEPDGGASYACLELTERRARQRHVIRRPACGDRPLAVLEAWRARN